MIVIIIGSEKGETVHPYLEGVQQEINAFIRKLSELDHIHCDALQVDKSLCDFDDAKCTLFAPVDLG